MAAEDTQSVEKKKLRTFSRSAVLTASSILVAVAVMLSVLWIGDSGNEDLLSLHQIQGGFVCEIQRDSAAWSSVFVLVADGNDSNGYKLVSDTLDDGQWVEVDFGVKSVGDLWLSFRVIDLKGDGTMGRGDSIIVTAVGSTEFPSDVVYRFMLWIGQLAISGTEYTMDFWFEGEELVTSSLETRWYPA